MQLASKTMQGEGSIPSARALERLAKFGKAMDYKPMMHRFDSGTVLNSPQQANFLNYSLFTRMDY
jgi:hypothetical protein